MVLFRMADNFIQGAAADELTAAFERAEKEETGEGVHEKYLAVLDALEREARKGGAPVALRA
jgi:hemerythrin-like domain-containing protein